MFLVKISLFPIFRCCLLLEKKTVLISLVLCRKKKKNKWKAPMQVFHIFSFCLIFVGWFWCDFCCVNIFLRFSMMFRGYVNFSGIFRTVWNFLWILELIFCLEFSAQFWNRKKLKKIYPCLLWLCWIFCVYSSDLEFDFLFLFYFSLLFRF